MKKEALESKSIRTRPHSLQCKTRENSNRFDAHKHDAYCKEISVILDRDSFIPPFYVRKPIDGKTLIIMPTYYNKSYVHREVQNKIPDPLRLNRTAVFDILISDVFEHVVRSKKEKGTCDLCSHLTDTIRGLETRREPAARAKLISAWRKFHNHTIHNRM